MKMTILSLLTILSATPALAAESKKPFYPLECSFNDLNHPERRLPEVFVTMADHDMPELGDNVISKRFEVPGFPGYYLEVYSSPAPVFATDQYVDLRLRTKAQLDSLDIRIALASGYYGASLETTLPGDTMTSIEIDCTPDLSGAH